MEETLNDTAVLLASLIEADLTGPNPDPSRIKRVMEITLNKRIASRIYSTEKSIVNVNVYVVNRRGVVLYDSLGLNKGRDFSRWNDVYLTLRGEYGSRSTRINPEDATTSSFYVAAPIRYQNEIIGSLTVVKPKISIAPFMENAKEEVAKMAALVLVMLLVAGFLITFWFTLPISRLTKYAEDLRLRKKVNLPRLGRSEIGILGESLAKMHRELEGKKYVEEYIQTLTHEIKSPLASIRASSELLEEGVPENRIGQLHTNIQKGIERMTEIIDRMLSLASLESREELGEKSYINLREMCRDLNDALGPEYTHGDITVESNIEEGIFVLGEKFLLRQAFENVIRNAIDFTPPYGLIKISLFSGESGTVFAVENTGAEIPEYALEHVFDRFFSLPRPRTGRRSSGLGLPFVKETVELHGGTVRIGNTDRGVLCSIWLQKV